MVIKIYENFNGWFWYDRNIIWLFDRIWCIIGTITIDDDCVMLLLLMINFIVKDCVLNNIWLCIWVLCNIGWFIIVLKYSRQ